LKMKCQGSGSFIKVFFCVLLLFLGLMSASVTHAETYNFVTKWGLYGSENGQFWDPTDVAVDHSGNVYVADSGNNRIQKFDSSGKYLTQWGSLGTGNGQFNDPWGIAVDSTGYVFVVDTYNQRIQKFDSDGKYLTQWGSQGNGNGQFNYSAGITVDSSGNVFVADAFNHRVEKFDNNGKYLTQWGSKGSGDRQFIVPYGIGVDSSGNVFVSDPGNNRIEKFDNNGKYLTQWGSNGSGNGQFDGPGGIVVDSLGNVFVADAGNNRIQKFDGSGKYLTQWGSEGECNGQFSSPWSIAVNSIGNVYVVDKYNNRIEEFTSNMIIYVNRTNYQYQEWGKYPIINLFGEKVIPLFSNSDSINNHVDKLAKLVIDSNSTYNIKAGGKLNLSQNYSLQVKQIDVDGKKVLLEFDKDGKYLDDHIISVDSGEKTWICTLNNIQGIDNVPVLKVHVSQISLDLTSIQINGLWLIDYVNTETLTIGSKFGLLKQYTLIQVINEVDMYNLGKLVFKYSPFIIKPIGYLGNLQI
jgi:S-layer protein (TIGR01567 family)